jgi:hypothetical protein
LAGTPLPLVPWPNLCLRHADGGPLPLPLPLLLLLLLPRLQPAAAESRQ